MDRFNVAKSERHPLTEILTFIATHMSFLWRGGVFKISGSEVYPSNDRDGHLDVSSARVRLRFVRERGQLLLIFQPIDPDLSASWYSVDLIRRLFLGQREYSGLLDEGYAAFLEANLPAIDELFAPEHWHATQGRLEALKETRATEMFS
jgi:hypothetical protein